MSDSQLIGLAAAALTTFSFVPQVVKIWRTRRAEDISLPAFSMMSTGVFLWFVYGLILRDLPLILANAITFALASSVLGLTIRLRLKKSSTQP